jgi:hypothetical protein
MWGGAVATTTDIAETSAAGVGDFITPCLPEQMPVDTAVGSHPSAAQHAGGRAQDRGMARRISPDHR